MFIWQESSTNFNEEKYSNSYNEEAPKNLRLAATLGLFFYNAFAVFDYLSAPELFVTHTFVRLCIVTPVILGIMFALRHAKMKKYLREGILLGAFVSTLSILYFESNRNPSLEPRDPIGLVFSIMFCLASLRMLRREAYLYSGFVMVSIIYLLSSRHATGAAWFSYLFGCGVACGIGIGISQIIEQNWRRNFQQQKQIERQEAQAAALLEMVFPVEIAHRLKSQKGSIAEFSGNVSVMFADIAGFTSISQSLRPEELVSDLDAIFSRIDELCALCGCEKIKTVGDAYLAVSGVPLPAADHADRAVRLAMAMQEDAPNMKLGGRPITFRIGIHSGPVVAGVIGKSRFSYDLWGDTVNTASRMESTAPAGGIQISTETAKLISNQFCVVSRGDIQVKGKGAMTTWLVTGVKKNLTSNDPELLEKIA